MRAATFGIFFFAMFWLVCICVLSVEAHWFRLPFSSPVFLSDLRLRTRCLERSIFWVSSFGLFLTVVPDGFSVFFLRPASF